MMARDQGCRAVYENQTWIPANETKAEGVCVLELCGGEF